MKDSKIIKVLIVEDIESLQKRYLNALNKDSQFHVVGCASNGYEAVMLATLHQPDVILMDIELEDKEAGLRATKEILKQFPHIKIIVHTVYEADETVFTAFKLGVCDYILKKSAPAEIVMAVRDAFYDRSPIRHGIADKIRREFQKIKTEEDLLLQNLQIVTKLTATELDILDLLVQGKSRKEICEIRTVELSTVKTQIHSILKKFNKESMSEIIATLKDLRVFHILRNREHA